MKSFFVPGTEEGKADRLAELRFLRGYYYFLLVQQFGPLPLVLQSSTGVRLEFERSPVSAVYKSIIADFRFAAENLPETQDEYGRITANAARHFLAKAYLTRGSAQNTDRGTRDLILARLAETYLMAAEAYGRNGGYVTALARLNEVRKRAGYADGEQKPTDYWKYDGGAFGSTENTKEEMLATEEYFSATDNQYTERQMYSPSATTKEQRFIHFILNERCRELLGEFYRWEDLARTETLIERALLFNPDAGNIKPYHGLRPIPQAHIDAIYRDGVPLTPEERAAEQNEGY